MDGSFSPGGLKRILASVLEQRPRVLILWQLYRSYYFLGCFWLFSSFPSFSAFCLACARLFALPWCSLLLLKLRMFLFTIENCQYGSNERVCIRHEYRRATLADACCRDSNYAWWVSAISVELAQKVRKIPPRVLSSVPSIKRCLLSSFITKALPLRSLVYTSASYTGYLSTMMWLQILTKTHVGVQLWCLFDAAAMDLLKAAHALSACCSTSPRCGGCTSRHGSTSRRTVVYCKRSVMVVVCKEGAYSSASSVCPQAPVASFCPQGRVASFCPQAHVASFCPQARTL